MTTPDNPVSQEQSFDDWWSDFGPAIKPGMIALLRAEAAWDNRTAHYQKELAAVSTQLRTTSLTLNHRIAELEAALLEAASDIEDWGQYAGEYFQNKHDLAGNVKRFKDIALPPEPQEKDSE